MRTPETGQVYRSPTGQIALYVRTEQRPGGKAPEHLFVLVKERVVHQRWMSSVPDALELVVDTEGRQQAEQEKWLRLAAEHDIEILLGLLKQACEWLPAERAQELRQRYRETRP